MVHLKQHIVISEFIIKVFINNSEHGCDCVAGQLRVNVLAPLNLLLAPLKFSLQGRCAPSEKFGLRPACL